MKKHTICLFLLLPLLASLVCSVSRIRPSAQKPTPQEVIPTVPATSMATSISPTKAPPSLGDIRLGQVELDMAALQQIQDSVDQGHEPWRLDPLQVAQTEGKALGFDPAQDAFDMLPTPNPATGKTDVIVLHGEHLYIIHLVQPVRVAPDGIWTVTGVNKEL